MVRPDKQVCCALATAFALIASAGAQNILSNGGFEAPVVSTNAKLLAINAGASPSEFGWTVNSGTVEVLQQGYVGWNGPFNGEPCEGQQWLDLDGVSAGSLSQAFQTKPRAEYALSFAYANNPYLVFPEPARATVRLTDTRSGLNLVNPLTISHKSSTASNYAWSSSEDIVFTAQGASTTLSFVSDDPASSNSGIFLDKVSVVPVPAPCIKLRAPKDAGENDR